jgi:hypothetical protein
LLAIAAGKLQAEQASRQRHQQQQQMGHHEQLLQLLGAPDLLRVPRIDEGLHNLPAYIHRVMLQLMTGFEAQNALQLAEEEQLSTSSSGEAAAQTQQQQQQLTVTLGPTLLLVMLQMLLQMAQDVRQWYLAVDMCMSFLYASLYPRHQLLVGCETVVPDLLPAVLLQLAPLLLKLAAAAACAAAGLEATQMEFRLSALVSALLFGSKFLLQWTHWG